MAAKPNNAARPDGTSREASSWRLVLAVAWLVGFSIYFHTRPMPNLRATFAATRAEAWQIVPFVLLDWIAPLPEDAPPNQAAPPPRSGWRFLPQRLALWSGAAVILAGSWGLGQLVLRRILPREDSPALERFTFVLGVGLSLVSLLTLGCGLAGFLERWFLIAVLVSAFLTAASLALRAKWNARNASAKSRSPQLKEPTVIAWDTLAQGLCVLVVLPFLAALLLGGVSPSTDFDVKEYHFQGPKEFFLAGRVQFLEHNVYTSFPFLTEMLTLSGMVLWNDWYFGALVGKTVLMSFIPLTGLAILAAGRRWFGPWAGWLGAMIWLTTPWATRIGIIAYAEGGLTFYLFAASFATAIACEQLISGKPHAGWFFLAGLLAGSAMACKYTGLVSVVLPMAVVVLMVVVHVWQKSPHKEARLFEKAGLLKTLGVFALGTALTIGPWLVKNLAETGNPVYPLAWSIFGGRDWDAGLNAKWTNAHSPDHHRLSSLFVLENGQPGWIIDVMAVNDWLSPLLYGLAPLVLLVPALRRKTRWAWLYVAWLFFAWWCFTHRLDRFWVPMLPLIAWLAGAGATWSSQTVWKTVCAVMIGLALMFNFAVVSTQNAGYVAGLTDLNAAAKFTAQLTAPEIHSLNQLADAAEPTPFKVLSVGEAEVFDAKFPIVYNTVFDRSIFQQWTAQETPGQPPEQWPMQSPAKIRARFQEAGITHVLVNWQEILRYRSTYGYVKFVEPKRFEWLVEQGLLEPPQILNRRHWDDLSASDRQELIQSGWREPLRDPAFPRETITLALLYRVR